MQRLVKEIRTAFAADNAITFSETAKLPYLAAVIEESLRFYPPLATGLPRVTPAGGEMVDGYFVPEKVRVRRKKRESDLIVRPISISFFILTAKYRRLSPATTTPPIIRRPILLSPRNSTLSAGSVRTPDLHQIERTSSSRLVSVRGIV